MRPFVQNLFLNTANYRERVQHDRALMVYAVIYGGLLAFTLFAFFSPEWYTTSPDALPRVSMIQVISYRPDVIIFLVVPYLIGLASVLINRSGRLQVSRWMATAFIYITAILPIIIIPASNFSVSIFVVNLVIFAFVTSLLNDTTGVLVGFGLAYASYITDPGEIQPAFFITFTAQMFAMMIIAYYFIRFSNTIRLQTEEIAGVERVKLAEITQTITRIGSERLSLDESLNKSIRILQVNYPQFYHVQVFGIDSTGVQARLVASTGDVGRVLLSRNHGLAVGSLSVIGQTTFKGEPIIAYANQVGTSYRPNDLLSQTKTEVAFPMRIGNQVIGALDMQSYDDLAFTTNDVATFQALADSIALVMDNVRQFDNARQRVEENQQLAEQARNALAEVQRLNKRLIGRAWSDYLRDQPESLGLTYDLESGAVSQEAEWTSTLEQAIKGTVIVQEDNIVSIPLVVRGQVIGAMEFELSEDGEMSADDIEMLKEVSERFGLAAENTRLLEQSQRSAQREALINVVSSRLQTTNNVEATLAEAARSLSELLQAERVVVRLGKPNITTAPLTSSGD